MKALIYFETVTHLHCLSVAAVTVLQPGTGMNIDVSSLDVEAVSSYLLLQNRKSAGFLYEHHPVNCRGCFRHRGYFQVLLFSLLSGGDCRRWGEKEKLCSI